MRRLLSRWLDPRRSLRARIGLPFACAALLAAATAGIYFDRVLPLAGIGLALAALGLWVAGRIAGHFEEMERALVARGAELENVIETMAEGLTIVDRDGIFVRVNAACEAIFGVPRERIVGRHVDQAQWKRELRAGLESQPEEMPFRRIEAGERSIRDLEYDILRPDGTRVPIALNAARLHDSNGDFAGVVATYVDITERRPAEEAARRSEQIQAATVAAALDAIITVDHHGSVIEFNPAAEACFGYARADVVGKAMVELLIPPHLRAHHREGFQRHLATGESRILGRRLEMPAMRADGSEIEIELSITRLPAHDPPVFTAFARDVTERKRMEEALRAAEERFRTLVQFSFDVYWETDAQHRFVRQDFANTLADAPRAGSEIGKTRWEVPYLEPDEEAWRKHRATLDAHEPFRDFELARPTPDGGRRYVSVSGFPVFDATGRFIGYRGVGRNITERKLAAQRIHYFATRDPLTDLANRASFTDRLELALESLSGESGRLAVLCVGIDRFTTINNSLGHRAGDRVLKSIAERITTHVGKHDVVARPGGDEFLVLLPRIGAPLEAAHSAELLRDAITVPTALDSRNVVLTASIGIAIHPEDGDSAATLLRNADAAMHHAKQVGNTVQFFAERMNTAAHVRLEMEAALRRGLKRGEFVLHYQPQVELATGRLAGFEALVRWQHPEQGLLPPGRFLPIAEEAGIILDLGEYVLVNACRQAAAWPGAPRIAVNVSARQFRYPGFGSSVRRAIDQAGLAAGRLELEIVENAIMDYGPETLHALRALGDMGIDLAIDDFGTGYSSLSYLRELPINTVKIDKSFVAGVPGSPEACAIVRAVVSLAHGLSLKVVAEGVETKAQADFLRSIDCDQAQGYFFGHPQPPEKLVFDAGANVFPIRGEAA